MVVRKNASWAMRANKKFVLDIQLLKSKDMGILIGHFIRLGRHISSAALV